MVNKAKKRVSFIYYKELNEIETYELDSKGKLKDQSICKRAKYQRAPKRSKNQVKPNEDINNYPLSTENVEIDFVFEFDFSNDSQLLIEGDLFINQSKAINQYNYIDEMMNIDNESSY